MKPTVKLRSFLFASGSLLLVTPAFAQLTWDPTGGGTSDGNGTWTNAGEWWDGLANVDWVDGNNAIFGNGGAGGTVTVGSISAGSVLLDDFSGTYTLQSGTITQSGGFTLGSTATKVDLKTTTITGAGGLTVSGGTLVANAATLSYAGATTVNGGGVLLSFNNLPTGNVTLNNGKISDYYRATTIFSNGLGTGASQVQIYGSSGFGGGNGNSNFRIGAQNSVLTWGAFEEGGNTNATGFFDPTVLAMRTTADNNGPSIYGQVTLQNRLDLNSGTRTIDVYRSGANVYGSSATIAGGIEDTGGSGNLIKTGDGTLILGTNTSTWGGATTVSGGILEFGGTNIANIGGGSGRNISVAAGAAVRFNALSNAILDRIAVSSAEFTVMTGTTGNAFDFSSHTGAFLANYAGNGAKAEISGIITAGGGAYRLGSAAQNGALGIRQESLLSGANDLIIGGNRVVIVGTHTFTGDTTIRDGGRLGLTGLNVDAGDAKNNSSGLQNSVLDLGAPTATGQIFLEAGTTAGAITGSTTSANGGTTSATFGGLKGSRNLYSAFLFTGPGNNTSATVATAVTGFTLNVGTGTTVTYSGNIGGFGAGAVTTGVNAGTGGAMTLTKSGAGTQILTATQSYTGATAVNAGTLIINGNISTSSLTTVASTATIGGSGTVGALTINAGGFVAPGNSPDTLDVAGNYIQAGTYNAEIAGNAVGNGTTGYDQIAVAGTVNITGGSLVALFSGTGYSAGDLIFLLLNDGSEAITGEYNTFTQGATVANYDGFDWNISYVANSAGVGSTFDGGNDIALMAVVIPEPSSAALLGALGALMLLRRRR